MELIRLDMTSKERKFAYARGEEIDRIPTTLSAGETAPPLYGIDIRDYECNPGNNRKYLSFAPVL